MCSKVAVVVFQFVHIACGVHQGKVVHEAIQDFLMACDFDLGAGDDAKEGFRVGHALGKLEGGMVLRLRPK